MSGEGKTMRRRVLHRVVGGVCLYLFLLPVAGRSQSPPLPPGCPPLPEQGPAKKISLYVVKALDKPGAVCIRVINRLSEQIEYGELAFWLQKWEEERREFQRIEEPDLRGTAVRLVAYGLPAGGVVDRRLPYSRQPAPPGKYRACFRFRMPGQSVDDEVYSEEFSLP
jgi:hypothetical protein